MKYLLKFTAFLTIVLLAFGAGIQVASAQSKSWEDSLVSPHTIFSMNFNVPRICDGLKNKEILGRFEKQIRNRHQIELSEIEQFQLFISNPPNQKNNADDTFNTNLTFRQAKKHDAQAVGKMSGYTLTATKIGEYDAFVGIPNNSGVWGAVIVNDRTLLFAVRRKMDSILESKDLDRPVEHKLEHLRMADVDACLTLSGGDRTKAVFEQAWGQNYFSELFGMYQKGLFYLDTQSETPLAAEVTVKDSASAEKLKRKLEEVIEVTKGHLKELESITKAAVPVSAILNSLEIELAGSTLRISSKEEAAKQMPELLINLMMSL